MNIIKTTKWAAERQKSAGSAPVLDDMATGSIKISFARGLYHDVNESVRTCYGPPDLIFCPNAGETAASIGLKI